MRIYLSNKSYTPSTIWFQTTFLTSSPKLDHVFRLASTGIAFHLSWGDSDETFELRAIPFLNDWIYFWISRAICPLGEGRIHDKLHSAQVVRDSCSRPILPRLYSDRDLRNQNLSHITAGYISNSPSLGIVLVDEASDSGLASSLFNYANTTRDGLVDNTLSTYSRSSSNVDVWRGYVNSAFPLFAQDFLVTNNAIFGGLVKRQFCEGYVASVSPSSEAPTRPKSLRSMIDRIALTKSWPVEHYVSRRDSSHSLRQ